VLVLLGSTILRRRDLTCFRRGLRRDQGSGVLPTRRRRPDRVEPLSEDVDPDSPSGRLPSFPIWRERDVDSILRVDSEDGGRTTSDAVESETLRGDEPKVFQVVFSGKIVDLQRKRVPREVGVGELQSTGREEARR